MIEVFDCDQRSAEWFKVRAGIPTASEFKLLLREGKDGGDSKTRRAYLHRLVGERISGEAMENYESADMRRGRDMEDEARKLYAFLADEPLHRVGFVRESDLAAGCSPDSLVGDKGILEIKTAFPHILVAHIVKGEFPSDHKAQCQGALLITDREWIDICIYWPTMPRPFIKRAYRDNSYLTTLRQEILRFNEELAAATETVRRYGQPSTIAADLRASLRVVA